MSATGTIGCQGELEKQQRFGWKKYNCVLDGFSFCMTPHGNSRLSLGSPVTMHTSEIMHVRGLPPQKASSKGFLIELTKTDNKATIMTAATEQERKKWLHNFSKTLAAYKEVSAMKTLTSHSPPPTPRPAAPTPTPAPTKATADKQEEYEYVEIRERTVSSYMSADSTYAEVSESVKADITREIEYLEASDKKLIESESKAKTEANAQRKRSTLPPPPCQPPPPPPQSPTSAHPDNNRYPEPLYATADSPEPVYPPRTIGNGKVSTDTNKPNTPQVLTAKPGLPPKPRSQSSGSQSPTRPGPRSPTQEVNKVTTSPSHSGAPKSPNPTQASAQQLPSGPRSPKADPSINAANEEQTDAAYGDKYAAIRRNSAISSRLSSNLSDPSNPKLPPPSPRLSPSQSSEEDEQRAEEIMKAMNKTFPPILPIPFTMKTVDTSSVEMLRSMLAASGFSKRVRPLSMRLGKGGEAVTQMKLHLRQISEVVEDVLEEEEEEEEEEDVFNTAF